jgi:hypothetical protein
MPLNLRPARLRYCEHGVIKIDNSATELPLHRNRPAQLPVRWRRQRSRACAAIYSLVRAASRTGSTAKPDWVMC